MLFKMRSQSVFYSVTAIRKLKFSKAYAVMSVIMRLLLEDVSSSLQLKLFGSDLYNLFLYQHYSSDLSSSSFLLVVSSLIHFYLASPSHSSSIWLEQTSQQSFLCLTPMKYILLSLGQLYRPSMNFFQFGHGQQPDVCGILVLAMHCKQERSKTRTWHLNSGIFISEHLTLMS